MNRLAFLIGLFFFIFAGHPGIASDEIPGVRAFYNPFPVRYDRYLIKVLDGLMPGKSTMKNAIDVYGEPYCVVNERYFFWEFRSPRNLRTIHISFFPPKKRFTRRYSMDGFDGRAVIKEIRVYDANRMKGYTTYLNDIVSFVPYPNELIFHSKENNYEMRFYEQGYSMLFDGDTELFSMEKYFPHEDLIIRGVYYLRIGTGSFLYIEKDYLY